MLGSIDQAKKPKWAKYFQQVKISGNIKTHSKIFAKQFIPSSRKRVFEAVGKGKYCVTQVFLKKSEKYNKQRHFIDVWPIFFVVIFYRIFEVLKKRKEKVIGINHCEESCATTPL